MHAGFVEGEIVADGFAGISIFLLLSLLYLSFLYLSLLDHLHFVLLDPLLATPDPATLVFLLAHIVQGDYSDSFGVPFYSLVFLVSVVRLTVILVILIEVVLPIFPFGLLLAPPPYFEGCVLVEVVARDECYEEAECDCEDREQVE